MLVNRDLQIAALGTLFHDCAQGKGTVAVIRGPVGSGKTALLKLFAERAAIAGATYLSAVASRSEQGFPLGVLGQLFPSCPLPAAIAERAAALRAGKLLAVLPGVPRPEPAKPPLAQALEDLLTLVSGLAQHGPVVLAVDDSHHADIASLQCLSYLARRTGELPVFTVLTESTHALPADRLLHAEILGQGNCHRITLPLLSASGVAGMLAASLGAEAGARLAPDWHAITGGSPALVRAVAEDHTGEPAAAPGAAFRLAVVTCLHRHDQQAVEAGRAIAILGQAAPAGLLGELLGVSPESVAANMAVLSSSGLLDEPGYFRHEQARQAVLDHMTADERAVMHGSAAGALYRAGTAPTAMARHLMAAPRIGAPWAVTVLREAAEQALAEGEAGYAIDYLRRAENECADPRQRASITSLLASVKWSVDPECATRQLPELMGYARAGLLDRESLSELAHYQLWMGDTDNAAEVLTALDVVGPAAEGSQATGRAGNPPAIRSPVEFLYPDAVSRVRHAARNAGRNAKGPAPLTPLTPLTPRQRDRASRSADETGKAHGEAVAIAAERILAECELDDPTHASVTTALMALICEDMLDRAASWCEILRRESAGPRSSPVRHAVLSAFLALIETRRGNLRAADGHARMALGLLTRKAWGVAIGGPLSSLLFSATAGRRHADAAACLRTPVPEAMFGTFHGLLYLYARGEYYLTTGRPRLALADFSDCGQRMMTWGLDLPSLIPWRTKAAEAHLAMGDNHIATELSREQLARAGSRFSRTRGISLRALALAGHPAKRTALLRESAEFLRNSGARLELTYTFIELSDAHQALGEHGRAQWAARQARELADRCGAPLPMATLTRADTGPRQSRRNAGVKAAAELSDAEQRVASLAAYGYTNGEIAHELYITVSTVEQHLTRIYRKLGVAKRTELPIDI